MTAMNTTAMKKTKKEKIKNSRDFDFIRSQNNKKKTKTKNNLLQQAACKF